MTKKILNIDSITNELEGASLFFKKSASPLPTPIQTPDNQDFATEIKAHEANEIKTKSLTQRKSIKAQVPENPKSRNIDRSVMADQPKSESKNVIDKYLHASNNASMQASNQPLIHETIVETIRKAVKAIGKDSATYRFTPEEKKALLELSFSYKMQGFKTSENELVRIAINFILEDQKHNGRNSVLQRVLDELNK